MELSTSVVRALPIPLPPLAEQKRIVAKVDELMALCDKLEALQNQRKAARAVLTKEILGRVASDATVDAQTCLQNLSLLVSDVEQIPVLRQTILSLAVQGKLVTLNPQYGDLDQEIEIAQRERAAYASKIGGRATRIEVLSQITECPYPIPSHWRWVALGNLALYIQRGKGPRYADRGKVQVISQKCVQWRGFDPTPARWIEDRSIGVYGNERFLQPDDLLWNSTGTGTVGRIVIFPGFKDKKMVADSHVTVLRPAKCLIPRYLWCLIASPGVQVRMDPTHKYPIVSGTTNQVELSTSVVRTLPIPLPPLAEQKRIVAKVDELIALCDTLEAKLRQASQAQEHMAISAIAALTGIYSQEKETMKVPKIEVVAHLKIGKKPSVKDQAPLAAILVRHQGELDSKALWQHSGMERIDDFYHQLKFEMSQGWIVQPETPSVRVVGER